MKGKRLFVTFCAVIMSVCIVAGTIGCGNDRSDKSAKTMYEITIVNGESVTKTAYEAGYKLVLEDKSKEGFEFLGYFTGDVKVESPYTVTSDAVLTVVYKYDDLGENLTNALKTYLGSESFEKSVSRATTAAAWLPLSYLRYVDGEFYTNSNAAVFRKYLNMIDELIVDGEISDGKWYGSAACAQGWYGITDYLYTYAIALNAYKEYLNGKGLVDNSADVYNPAIGRYLEKTDRWLSHNNDKYDILGEEVTQANLYYTAYNQWNRFSLSGYEKLGQEKTARLLECVAQATGSDAGHKAFLSDYATLESKYRAIKAEEARIAPQLEVLNEQYSEWNNKQNETYRLYRDMEDGEEKEELKKRREQELAKMNEIGEQRTLLKADLTALTSEFNAYGAGLDLMSRFKSFMPITQVSFGMSTTAYLAIVNANLSLEASLPYVDNAIMSRYEKDGDGNFVKEGGTPNWVGPTGAPIAASLYRDREGYDVNFEKYRQGYFPFTDGWNQPLSELITLDLYGKYYNHTLTTGANVTPQWGLLTGYMHGIDMENYEVGQPIDGEPTKYNIISLWLENLKQDEQGNYIIGGNIDMAVAICYLAYINGIEAPTPLGTYNPADKVIEL